MTNEQTRHAYDVKSYDDVKRLGLKIGVINDSAYSEDFWAAFSSPDRARHRYFPLIEPATSAEMNLRKLEANRIQLFPIPLVVGDYLAAMYHLRGLTHYDGVIFSKAYPAAFSKASRFATDRYPTIAAFASAYDDALLKMKADTERYQQFFALYKLSDAGH